MRIVLCLDNTALKSQRLADPLISSCPDERWQSPWSIKSFVHFVLIKMQRYQLHFKPLFWKLACRFGPHSKAPVREEERKEMVMHRQIFYMAISPDGKTPTTKWSSYQVQFIILNPVGPSSFFLLTPLNAHHPVSFPRHQRLPKKFKALIKKSDFYSNLLQFRINIISSPNLMGFKVKNLCYS